MSERNWQSFALAPGVEFSRAAADTAQFSAGPRVLRIGGLGPSAMAALGTLGPEPQALAGLEAAAGFGSSNGDAPGKSNGRLTAILLRLCGQGLATLACLSDDHDIGDDGVLGVATAIGGFTPRWDFGPLDPAKELQLSSLAWCARRGSELVLEAAASGVRVAIKAPEVAFIAAAFAAPARPADVLERTKVPAAQDCLEFLSGLGILVPASLDSPSPEDLDPVLAVREVHDVAVQLASRSGFAAGRIGATLRFSRALDPQPAVRDWPGRPETALPRPDLDTCRTAGKSLQRLIDDRRSRRAFGPAPVTLGQLGEFLFRVARVYKTWEMPIGPGVTHQISARPYPSGGACHDVEFYLAVRRCEGLTPGIYHYHPVRHALALVTADTGLVTAFHAGAILASAGGAPDVVIVLASRFARNAWKYQGLALTIGLKNIGVIMELMYLTAADMGLACCGLGDGDSAVFARATGLHPLAESSMGEFMLGTMCPDDGGPRAAPAGGTA